MTDQLRHARTTLAVVLAAAMLVTGCAATPQTGPGDAATRTGPIISPSASGNPSSPTAAIPSHSGGGGDRSSAATPGLPADWPRDLPLPQGTVIGSTGSNGHWTVQIRAAGSAAQARQSVADFYTTAGFTAVSDSVLNNGNRQITLVVENRDHSATETNVVIQVSTP